MKGHTIQSTFKSMQGGSTHLIERKRGKNTFSKKPQQSKEQSQGHSNFTVAGCSFDVLMDHRNHERGTQKKSSNMKEHQQITKGTIK